LQGQPHLDKATGYDNVYKVIDIRAAAVLWLQAFTVFTLDRTPRARSRPS
jgi:hypothetical protein